MTSKTALQQRIRLLLIFFILALTVIAVAFIGPLRDPIRNMWVIEFGMIACILIIPWALMFGVIRHIPWFWSVIDMSFGIFGIGPLWLIRRDILRLTRGL